jgi:hypothetical protein
MPTNGSIQLIPGPEVNREKWDACLDRSTNGLLYAYSFYLDRMAIHWDALVLDDYAAVMPLTGNRKWRMDYLYQPFSCASLGVFGQAPSSNLIEEFLAAIPRSYRYIDISLNTGNLVSDELPGLRRRRNYTLSLSQKYELMQAGFSDNHSRNLRKAAQQDYTISHPPAKAIIAIARQQMKQAGAAKEDDYQRFENLCQYLHAEGAAETYAVINRAHEMMAGAIFFHWRKRAYYILAGNTAGGKMGGASHALVDAFIRNQAGSGIVLDFEGSDVPGIARFYDGFGATEETYPALRQNRMPAVIRWLKP